MSSTSGFKYVFWGLAVLAFLLQAILIFPIGKFALGIRGAHVPMVAPLFILVAAYIAIVGALVYRDASRRGMDPWLWATVGAFVPYLVGVIIYLIARSNVSAVCTNCGRGIRPDYSVCPYCGHAASSQCEKCGQPIEAGWKVCPRCGHAIETSAERAEGRMGERATDPEP